MRHSVANDPRCFYLRQVMIVDDVAISWANCSFGMSGLSALALLIRPFARGAATIELLDRPLACESLAPRATDRFGGSDFAFDLEHRRRLWSPQLISSVRGRQSPRAPRGVPEANIKEFLE